MSMKVTKILMEEHQIILRQLDRLEDLLDTSDNNIINEIDYYFDFIKYYSDEFHHAKEEDIYFQWMIAKNPGLEFGPIKCMLSEHDLFRTLVDNAKNAFKNNDIQLAKQNLTEFVAGLRMHINKEDNVLYKMADTLNDNDGDELMYGKFMESNHKLANKISILGDLST